jgi:hypothetical protein
MPVWVSEWETEGRTNMAKEEVVEKKYARCNIFPSFFLLIAFVLGCFGPIPF